MKDVISEKEFDKSQKTIGFIILVVFLFILVATMVIIQLIRGNGLP